MRKLILFFLSLFLLTSCYVWQYANITEPIVKVYDVNGTKDALFLKANLWMVSTFNSAKSVIQYSDKVEGVFAGKYLLHDVPAVAPGYNILVGRTYGSPEVTLYATIEITIKDNKARISVLPENWRYSDSKDNKGQPMDYTKEKALADIDALCESFNKGLQAKSTNF